MSELGDDLKEVIQPAPFWAPYLKTWIIWGSMALVSIIGAFSTFKPSCVDMGIDKAGRFYYLSGVRCLVATQAIHQHYDIPVYRDQTSASDVLPATPKGEFQFNDQLVTFDELLALYPSAKLDKAHCSIEDGLLLTSGVESLSSAGGESPGKSVTKVMICRDSSQQASPLYVVYKADSIKSQPG